MRRPEAGSSVTSRAGAEATARRRARPEGGSCRVDRRWVALALVVISCRSPEAGEKEEAEGPVKVACRAATPSTMIDRIHVRGVVAAPPNRQATVASTVAGRVSELLVQEGEPVERGAVLAVIDDPALEAAQGEADALLASARAADKAAAATAARARRLLDEGIAPRRDLEDADAKAAQAAAELRATLLKRDLATVQRGRAKVKAPIAGTVVRILRRAGELVDGTPQTPIVEIADPVHLELRADVAGSNLVRLFPGLLASVRLDAVRDHPFPGRVIAVSPGVDPTSALGWVRVALDVPAESPIKPRLGLAGEAEVLVGARAGLVAVPAAAVRRGAAGHAEVLVCDKDAAKVAEVTIAGRSGGDLLLGGGIDPGTRVIVDHVLNIEDGAKIAPEVGEAP